MGEGGDAQESESWCEKKNKTKSVHPQDMKRQSMSMGSQQGEQIHLESKAQVKERALARAIDIHKSSEHAEVFSRSWWDRKACHHYLKTEPWRRVSLTNLYNQNNGIRSGPALNCYGLMWEMTLEKMRSRRLKSTRLRNDGK